MSKFQYRRLDETANEIRVVTIWPGRFDDPIKIDISQCPLIPPSDQNDSGLLSAKDINKTLPDDSSWEAFETLEGRIIFTNDDSGETSWTHPDPSMDRCLYDRESLPQIRTAQPVYEALSYTWGPQSSESYVAVKAITALNEETQPPHQGLLAIGQNLDEAIRYLRYPHKPRTMWIDALCINQGDIEERNHEVKRMGDIFRFATRVVAWIGPAYEGSTSALATMRDVAQHIVWKSNGVCRPRPGCSNSPWLDFSTPLRLNKLVEIAIANLFSRSWFRRLWVLQEIHLSSPSSIVQCGQETILWKDLQGAAMILISKHDDGAAGRLRQHIWEMSRICFYNKAMKLDDLLWKYHDLGCQLPHDRIYGLMNLAPSGWSKRIEPDYSLPALDVYRDASLAYLSYFGRLDLLLRTGVNGIETLSSVEQWPSWVPDWTARALDTIPPGLGFSASSFSPAHTALHGPNELEVAGIRLGAVTHMYRLEIDSFVDLAEYFNQLGLEKLIEKEYLPGQTVLDAHLHVITNSRFDDRNPCSGRPSLEQFREHILDLAHGRESRHDLTQYESNIIVGLVDSYCFITSDGYLGRCRTRGTVDIVIPPGDEVFIPLGCQTPILVRPTTGGKHRTLGDCYVHGVMSGETLLGPLPADYIVQGRAGPDGVYRTKFLNKDTGVHTLGDPRLVPIPFPKGWLFLEFGMEVDDPDYCSLFRNSETGKIVDYDPRMTMICAWRVRPEAQRQFATTMAEPQNPQMVTSPQFPNGIEVIHEDPDAIVDICFVHGFTGGRRTAWTAQGQSEPWLKTLLPSHLSRVRILTFGYDPFLQHYQQSTNLRDQVLSFLVEIVDYRSRAPSRPLILVAHCFGGLVCQDAINICRASRSGLYKGVFLPLKGIILISTPYLDESWKVYWGKISTSDPDMEEVAHLAHSIQMHNSQGDENGFDAVRKNFFQAMKDRSEDDEPVGITFMFAELEASGLSRVIPDRFGFARLINFEFVPVKADHVNIAKFSSRHDSGFKAIANRLSEWVARVGKNEHSQNILLSR
ncbi:heterokaryon incompatibility [Fusarium longipes]|uniref:Heterokaryon incompatibility n=1 Tax=Fusarium longipes TaxID=694270 RepID=A0A395T3I2_9HYPO|nr:heterokaryon incompatibility [Fusarium longipes]